MLTIQSPHFSNSSKVELLSHVSPTFRNKRIPSAQDNYSYSSNHNLKISKTQSPSKFSQKLKRRKSQYINPSHANHAQNISANTNNPQAVRKKKTSQLNQVNFNISNNSCGKDLLSFNANNPQTIISEMTYLKNEYKQLKAAYKQLIQQKINNTQQIANIKQQKRKVEAELQLIIIQNQKMKSKQQLKRAVQENQRLIQKIKFYESEVERIRKQSFKMLEVEKLKAKRLQQILREREQAIYLLTNNKNQAEYTSCGTNQEDSSNVFIMNTAKNNREKQPTQKDNTPNMNPYGQKCTEKMKPFDYNLPEESLFISQSKSISNNSQFISISLTSIMEESFCKIQTEANNKERQTIKEPIAIKQIQKQIKNARDYKQLRALTQIDTNHIQIVQNNKQVKKEYNEQQKQNMKKLRKEANQKLQINIQKIDKKQFPSLKTPINDKKVSNKLKYSKSKRKQQQKQNTHHLGKQSLKQFGHNKQKENQQTNRKKQKHSKRID